jgi:RecA-family ATPase
MMRRDYALVIVDSLAALFSILGVDDFNSAAKVLPVMNALAELAHNGTAALVLLHHASKATGRYRDSTALGGAVDMIVEMKDPEDTAAPTRRDFAVKGRISAENFTVRFDGTQYTRANADAPVEIRIIEFLRAANAPQSKTAIRRHVRGGSQSKDAALIALLERGLILKDGDGYSVPLFGTGRDSDNDIAIRDWRDADDGDEPEW